MELSRRTFLSSSLVAGLIAAAEATHSRWLLARDTPIRIGLANFGESGVDQTALFSAIPGTEVAGLFGIHDRMVHTILAQIKEHGKPRPAFYENVDHLLSDPTLHVISASGRQSAIAPLLGRIVAAKLPLLSDVPLEFPDGEQERTIEILSMAKAPVHFRMNYFEHTLTVQDVKNWLSRSSARKLRARLTVPVWGTNAQISRAGTLSLTTLFEACNMCPRNLRQWLPTAQRNISVSKGLPCGKVPMPGNPYGISCLQFLPCSGNPDISTLSLDHVRGSLRIPIGNNSNVQSMLRSTMRFLNQVRFPKETDNSGPTRALIASLLMSSFQDSFCRIRPILAD